MNSTIKCRLKPVVALITVISLFTFLIIILTGKFVKPNYESEMLHNNKRYKKNLLYEYFYADDELKYHKNSDDFKNKIDYTKFKLNSSKIFNILMWTSDKTVPFVHLKKGNEIFLSDKCEYSNCFMTRSLTYLKDLTQFDSIIFHGKDLLSVNGNLRVYPKPHVRSEKQIYVFASIESPHNYPICTNQLDNYFNWTWTYKLSSEVVWGYVDIRDTVRKIIGPKEDMTWVDDDNVVVPVQTLDILRKKTKAIAWLVSNCVTKSTRENYVRLLRNSLKEYDLDVDIYGECGDLKCGDLSSCLLKFKNDYFFYLSFENSFAEDYVTEKLTHAFKNYVVPIVWGGADYSRFAPPSSYINARETDPDSLASLVKYLMDNPFEYASYFKWRRYYQYQRGYDTPETRHTCRFCKALNMAYGKPSNGSNPKYADFKSWWNAGIPNQC